MTTLPLLTDIRAVLEATLHTYVGNRAGRDELVRVLRRMDDEQREETAPIVTRKAAPAKPAPVVPSEPAGLYRKEICYDRETHDYAMYLDGELVGFQRTYHDAEITLDQLVFELMSGQYFKDAA